MKPAYPPSWSGLRFPWVRTELLAYIEELATPDPPKVWQAARDQGRISSVDEVIHFFFDDHEFDVTAVGAFLLDQDEMALVQSVCQLLDLIVQNLPHGGDDAYFRHALWPTLREAAIAAHEALRSR